MNLARGGIQALKGCPMTCNSVPHDVVHEWDECRGGNKAARHARHRGNFLPRGGLPREMPREIGAPKGRPAPRRGACAPKKQAASVEIFFDPFLTLFGAPRRGAP